METTVQEPEEINAFDTVVTDDYQAELTLHIPPIA